MTKNPTDLLDLDFRWPRKGDRLLKAARRWREAVAFDGHELSRDAHMWSGYMRAGALLVDACQEASYERNKLVYPILFNYRQGIELAMKWIVLRYGGCLDIPPTDVEHHDLLKLWTRCKRIFAELTTEDDAIPVVEQVVKDFHDLDKSGVAFRYSRKKQRAELIELPERFFDLANVREVMEGIDYFFIGADGQLDATTSAMGDV